MECVLNGVRPEEGIVDASGFLLDSGNEAVIAGCVSISRGSVALWCRAIPIPPPWGYEGREVEVGFREGDGVVAVPGIEDGLLGVLERLWPGGTGTVCGASPGCVLVQLLKINGPPEGPVLLDAYDHSMAPSGSPGGPAPGLRGGHPGRGRPSLRLASVWGWRWECGGVWGWLRGRC